MEASTPNSGQHRENDEHSPMLVSSSSTASPSTKLSTADYEKITGHYLSTFCNWDDREQLIFVENLLKRMHSHQHAQINMFLLPMLQRDFVGQLAARGLDHIAEKILGYLDDHSLTSTELVCHDWYQVISQGMTRAERQSSFAHLSLSLAMKLHCSRWKLTDHADSLSVFARFRNALEETHRTSSSDQWALARAWSTARLDQVSLPSNPQLEWSTENARVLPAVVPEDLERHQADRIQLAQRTVSTAEDPMPLPEQQRRLLFTVRRREDHQWSPW